MKVKIQIAPTGNDCRIWIDDQEWTNVYAVEVKAEVENVTRVLLSLHPSSVEIEGDVDALEQATKRKQLEDRPFPILSEDRRQTPPPHSVPWAWIEQFEARALQNHDQTIERLAQRGGMGWHEILGLMRNVGGRAIAAFASTMPLVDAQKLVLAEVAKWRAR